MKRRKMMKKRRKRRTSRVGQLWLASENLETQRERCTKDSLFSTLP